jgi:hypothetical protein
VPASTLYQKATKGTRAVAVGPIHKGHIVGRGFKVLQLGIGKYGLSFACLAIGHNKLERVPRTYSSIECFHLIPSGHNHSLWSKQRPISVNNVPRHLQVIGIVSSTDLHFVLIHSSIAGIDVRKVRIDEARNIEGIVERRIQDNVSVDILHKGFYILIQIRHGLG